MLFGFLPFVRTFLCPIPYFVVLFMTAQVIFIIKTKVELDEDISAAFTVLLSPICETKEGDFRVTKVFRDFRRIFSGTLLFLYRGVNYEEVNENKSKNQSRCKYAGVQENDLPLLFRMILKAVVL